MKPISRYTLILALVFPCCLQALQVDSQKRRQLLQTVLLGAGSGLFPVSKPAVARDTFTAYQVYPDATSALSPTLGVVQVSHFFYSILFLF